MATYYVDPVSGNDGNAGTSAGAAWASISHAAATVAAGDRVILMATGTHSIASTVSIVTSSVLWSGANASGVIDGTRATIQGPSGSVAFVYSTGNLNMWDKIIFVAPGLSLGVFNYNALTLRNFYSDCEFDGSGTTTRLVYNSNTCNSRFLNCYIHGFSGSVVNQQSNRNGGDFTNCYIEDCTALNSSGAYAPIVVNCVFKGTDISATNYGAYYLVDRCTFYDSILNVGDRSTSSQPLVVMNSIFAMSPGYAINWWGGGTCNGFIDFCLFYNNTSGDLGGAPSGVALGPNCITGSDPLFLDAANGDFSLEAGSPAKGSGYWGLDIGARRAADAAGGGGGTRAYAI